MMTIRSFASLVAGAVLASGCATALRGPNVDFSVITEPPGAIVTTNLQTKDSILAGKRIGSADASTIAEFEPAFYGCEPTPCKFELSRRSEFEVVVKREGYHPATIKITSGFGSGASTKAATGAAVTATGVYVVSYGVVNGLTSAFGALLTAGSASASSSGAAAVATTAATGIGVLFVGVDLATGSMLNLQPNPLVLILIPEDEPLPEVPHKPLETPGALKEILRERNTASDLS